MRNKLRNISVIGSVILALSPLHFAEAATVQEIEQQLGLLKKQVEILQNQLREVQPTPPSANISNTPQSQVVAPIVQPSSSITPLAAPQPAPVLEKKINTRTDIIRVDSDGYLFGEGKKSNRVNSVNIAIGKRALITNTPKILPKPQKDVVQALNAETKKPSGNLSALTKKQILPAQNMPNELRGAITKVQTGQFPEAQAELTNYVANEQNPKLDSAYYWLGESLFRQSQYEPAALAFTKSYSRNRTGDMAPDALIRLSSALGLLNKTKEACALLLHAVTNFPQEKEKIAIANNERQRLQCKN